jgi:hypothetical protein
MIRKLHDARIVIVRARQASRSLLIIADSYDRTSLDPSLKLATY